MKMGRESAGFSLIELTVVIAIVAILAAIAIPLYLNFTARAEGAEALTLGSGIEPHVAEYYNEHQKWPKGNPANDVVGAAAPGSIRGEYVTAVAVNSGRLVMTFGNKANAKLTGHTLTLSPSSHGGSISWTCSVDTSSIYRLVPSQCRNSN